MVSARDRKRNVHSLTLLVALSHSPKAWSLNETCVAEDYLGSFVWWDRINGLQLVLVFRP